MESVIELGRPDVYRRPAIATCTRCGEQADTWASGFGRYQSQRDAIPACWHCLPILQCEEELPEYELTEEDQEKLDQELRERGMEEGGSTARETGALVIRGRNIRFKTPRELAREHGCDRNGMPPERRSLRTGVISSFRGDFDDPFNFGGDALSERDG